MPRAKVKFGDAANPSAEELRAWAACADLEPMEDWDLVLASPRYVPVLLDLVADEDCPSRRYVLGALYVYAADAVRNGFADEPRAAVERHVAAARATGNAWLAAWADRTVRLIADPASFDYAAWCAGGNAKRPMD